MLEYYFYIEGESSSPGIMADGMGMRVIAEGVETEDQAQFLRTCQCPEVQGYLFSRPLNRNDATAFFAEASIA